MISSHLSNPAREPGVPSHENEQGKLTPAPFSGIPGRARLKLAQVMH
ncbi:MAG: hypothetical protein ACE5FQ_08530 [Thiogranum sp.]